MKTKNKIIYRIMGLIAFTALIFGAVFNFDKVSSVATWILSLFFPILLGLCIAFVLNIPLTGYEKIIFKKTEKKILKKLRRPISMILAVATLLLIITAVILLIIPEVSDAVVIFANSVPPFVERMKIFILENAGRLPALQQQVMELNFDWGKIGESIFDILKNGAAGLVGSTMSIISSTLITVVNSLVALIFGLYVLLNKEKLADQSVRLMSAYLKEPVKERILHIGKICYTVFKSFISGQCIEACILGALCFLGMLVLRLPYATMVAALVGITALIPVVGAFLGVGVGAFMILMIDPMKAFIFLIFFIVLQQIEGNVIYPKVVGASVGLPGLWVLAAVTVGGGVSGVIGMLFAVPVASVIYILLKENVQKRLLKKEQGKNVIEPDKTPD